MGLWPHLPDDGEERELGSGLPPDLYEIWAAAVRELYPDALTIEEAKARLEADAEDLLERLRDGSPRVWGQAQEEIGDPVEWAEEVTAQAVKAQASIDALHRMQEDPVIREDFPKRLGALRRAEERSRVPSTRKALDGLLRAAKALRRALRKHS